MHMMMSFIKYYKLGTKVLLWIFERGLHVEIVLG